MGIQKSKEDQKEKRKADKAAKKEKKEKKRAREKANIPEPIIAYEGTRARRK